MDLQPIPETMLEAVRQFADPDVAHDFFVQLRWPNGIACPRKGCGSADMVSYMPKHRRWYCGECKGQFSAKVGTIFEDSPIGFDKWLPAIWLIASNRNGISSCELARALKVTQKTAWFMLHRIRLAMNTGSFTKFSGTVEVDETYVGGKVSSKPKKVRKALRDGNPTADKVMVLGMVERKGRVRAWVLPGSKPTTKRVVPLLRQHIDRDATVDTDAAPIYKDLNEFFLVHDSVNHTADEYVRGAVSTNNIESFWSVFKRTLKGTYVAPRPWQLHRYLDEQIFRFNEREERDGWRFVKAVKGTDQKRLTYRTLIAKQ